MAGIEFLQNPSGAIARELVGITFSHSPEHLPRLNGIQLPQGVDRRCADGPILIVEAVHQGGDRPPVPDLPYGLSRRPADGGHGMGEQGE
jgi:hypothetical protein